MSLRGSFLVNLVQIPAAQDAGSLSFRSCQWLCVGWGTGADKDIWHGVQTQVLCSCVKHSHIKSQPCHRCPHPFKAVWFQQERGYNVLWNSVLQCLIMLENVQRMLKNTDFLGCKIFQCVILKSFKWCTNLFLKPCKKMVHLKVLHSLCNLIYTFS